ncbi:hypothetical protein Taro_007025 [Colocasia esculenta]|uniref:Uncharacterized protein n=1 Tax=Colocasia esculenta TaxID=4460 RepID=A0A843TX16_COLES|nr:hypothetical protein [Colocasia esculenta]
METTTACSAGLPSHEGNYTTLDTPPGLPSQQKGTTTPWKLYQVFLQHRREQQQQRTNISCKGSVDTTINGVDTMVQNKGRNVKKSSSSVDTSPGQVDTTSSQVDTRDLSQGIDLPVWDSVSTHLKGRCNKSRHMKGECPENKKEKHKKIHKFKKPKAMVATWSDEDSSEEEEEEKSSSSESQVDTTPSSVDTLSLRSTLTSSSVDTDPLLDSFTVGAG